MLFIQNNNTDPYFNLALEEYLLKEFRKEDSGEAPEDCFMLWQNEPCIVVGKNQNVLNEINEEYVKKNNVKVVRRLSGGGAVFHDLGNLNFTFIINDTNNLRNYKTFTTPIVEVLAKLGVEADFSERNDLIISGLKFSGNAQYKHKNRLLHHGTILFSSSLKNIKAALKPNNHTQGRWVKSVPSPVTNVQEHLSQPLTMEELKIEIQKHIATKQEKCTDYDLTLVDIDKVNKLVLAKYATNDWNYGNLVAV